MSEVTYSIKEVGQQTGLSADTIRYYEKIGLLPSIARSQAGVRRFSDQDVAILNFINHFKSVGMSLDTLKTYLDLAREGEGTIAQRSAILQEERQRLKEQEVEIRRAINLLDAKIDNYEQTLAKCERKVFGEK